MTVVRAYLQFQEQCGIQYEEMVQKLRQLESAAQVVQSDESPVEVAQWLHKEGFERHACRDLAELFASRHSVRDFAQKPVDRAVIETVVRMAQWSPSACNRQSARVWVLTDRQRIQGALAIQGGARGSADRVALLFVVTSDLACWQSAGERYQGWIDGALFAMTLVWALHSRGLVSCMLNWSKRKETDKELRRYLGIEDSELIVVLVAAGYPAERFRVCRSPRLPLENILRYDQAR